MQGFVPWNCRDWLGKLISDLAKNAKLSAIHQEAMTSICRGHGASTTQSHRQHYGHFHFTCLVSPHTPRGYTIGYEHVTSAQNGLFVHLLIIMATMFILQTTTAVLISFLAIFAYNVLRNRVAKGGPRRKDLETPGSPTIPITNDVKPSTHKDVHTLCNIVRKESAKLELEAHKQLYYKLHNLEEHPDVLSESRELLLSLLSSTLIDAYKAPESGILSLERFTPESLDGFLKAKDVDVTNRWEAYIARRKAGQPREMFTDKSEAQWWLKQAAPVKYIDGAWLGHINKISTPFKFRNITKNAWQVMSEELGDGDLAKNHVHVYRDLMKDVEAGLPPADSEDFIHARHELNEARCWKAALAQMLISLFPHDFLPEALGFNMAYESLPLHLLKTVKELRELRLNPYYFELHISIDNADSGHAAMAMAAVATYVDVVKQTEGEEAAHVAWKRVQAGYILAEGLPTTPESPSLKTSTDSFPRSATEAAVVEIFAAKSFVAHKIHCNSRLRIGRKSLVEWLEPNAFRSRHWQEEFLHDLSNCKPWVIQGDSDKSRLVRELSWEGKMFGSFTQTEVEAVKAWIDDLGEPIQTSRPDATAYLYFTQRQPLGILSQQNDILCDYPVVLTPPQLALFGSSNGDITTAPSYSLEYLNISNLLPLWFTSSTLLESLPSVPVRAASHFGSALIRVLRAENGFATETEGVAGMDEVRRTEDGGAIGIMELGLEMCKRARLKKPENLRDAVSMGNAEMSEFAEWMVHMGMRWLANSDLLVGMSWGFMELHEILARATKDDAVLSKESMAVLENIALRERIGLEICRKEIEGNAQQNAEFTRGLCIAQRAIYACCT
jgi:hypothetical protein